MATYDEEILHGDRCDCTLHDIGLNCRRALTRTSLDRELDELVHAAFHSGFTATDVVQTFLLAVGRRRAQEEGRW